MEQRIDRRGGARPNAGRKKKDTEIVTIRVPSDVAVAIRAYAKEHEVTMATATQVIFGEGIKV